MIKKIGKALFAIILVLGLIAAYFVYIPTDIRPAYLKEIETPDYAKGKALLEQMEAAHGGYEQWKSYKRAVFVQVAEWYGRLRLSQWDEVPQRFELTCDLGTDNSQMLLVNGPNKGTRWAIEDGKTYKMNKGTKEYTDYNQYSHKMVYKSYWFQFPFRVREAEFVAYAGEEVIDGTTYDLVYATWGTETANSSYDQFVLYLNKETHLLEWLYFTVREKVAGVGIHAKFENFKYVDRIILPHDQYVRYGKPGAGGTKLHENHYEVIRLGASRILR